MWSLQLHVTWASTLLRLLQTLPKYYEKPHNISRVLDFIDRPRDLSFYSTGLSINDDVHSPKLRFI